LIEDTAAQSLSEIKDNSSEVKILFVVEVLKTADGEILSDVKEVKALIEKNENDQRAEILVEVRDAKALVSKIRATNGTAEEVGENDQGIEVTKKVEGNGVKAEESEIVPEA
jgi:hypothetical protein